MQTDRPEQDIDRKQRCRLARLLLERPQQLLPPSVAESSPLRRPLHLWSLPELECLLSEFWGPNIDVCGRWLARSFGPVAQKLNVTTSAIRVHTCNMCMHYIMGSAVMCDSSKGIQFPHLFSCPQYISCDACLFQYRSDPTLRSTICGHNWLEEVLLLSLWSQGYNWTVRMSTDWQSAQHWHTKGP